MPADPAAAIDDVRALLPAWVLWSQIVVYPVLAFVVSLVSCWLAGEFGLRAFRKCPDTAGWMERARLAFPARAATRIAVWALPLLFVLLAPAETGPLWHATAWSLALAGGLTSFAAAWIVALRVARIVLRVPVTWRQGARATLADFVIRWPHLFVAIALAALLPERFDRAAVLWLGGASIVFLFLVVVGGVLLGRLAGLAVPAPPGAQSVVALAAARVGVAPSGAYVVESVIANALAFPLCRRLLFTSRLLEVLEACELQAIAAHELDHLGEPLLVSLARTVPAMLLLPLAAFRPLAGSFGYQAYAAVLAAFALSVVSVRRLARRMEEAADRAAGDQQSDEGTFARALEKIYAANMTPAVLRGRTVHPYLYDRMVVAGITPAQPRPKPPSQSRQLAALAIALGPTLWLLSFLNATDMVDRARQCRDDPASRDAARLSFAAGSDTLNADTPADLPAATGPERTIDKV